MSYPIVIPDSTRQSLSKHVREGIFVSKRITFWRGRPEITMGREQKLSFSPSKVLFDYDSNTAKLRFQIRRLLYFYTFKTKYGIFVPKQNIGIFWEKIEDFRKRHKDLYESVCSNYDEIMKEVKRRYAEVARFKWSNGLGHPGDPPESFVESFSSKFAAVHTKGRIERIFRFDVFPTSPILSLDNPSYGPKEQIEKMNYNVVTALYNGIAANRRTFLRIMSGYRDKVMNGLRPYKAIANFCQLYKNSTFYGDPVLIEKIESLRLLVMQTMSRDSSVVSSLMKDMIECIVKNDLYPIGYIYDRKV